MKTRKILVAGDVVTEHNIWRGSRHRPEVRGLGTRVTKSQGGAALLAELLRRTWSGNGSTTVSRHQSALPNDGAYALWIPQDAGEMVVRGKVVRAWRVAEQLGYGVERRETRRKRVVPADECDIAVIDDGGRHFRGHAPAWPSFLGPKPKVRVPKWIILKMSHPVCSGDLWAELSIKHDDRLIVLVAAHDLRLLEVLISSDRSWEDTEESLLSELAKNPLLADLHRCRHLVVSFGSEGAVWVEPGERKSAATLIFDPANLEGDWDASVSGTVPGVGACLTAGVASIVAENTTRPDVADGITRGLIARRALIKNGYGMVDDDAKGDPDPGFPFEQVVPPLRGGGGRGPFTVRGLPKDATARVGQWSLLAGRQGASGQPLYGQARQVARKGIGALTGIPHRRFGKLFTVDRHELERFDAIKGLMTDYLRDDPGEKPLCFGVFGPPGAGKSFGVKQIAKGVLGPAAPILEYNLSQFQGPEELIGAFHEVRDRALRGAVPLVFWDEFDSRQYYWLQYLLAPMQDGIFREGQLAHPIGKCVFVFAGGTSPTFERFGPQDQQGAEYKDFKLLKGPDFVSRLRGYLNVLGPNRRRRWDETTNAWVDDETDVGFPIRRALLLRAQAGAAPTRPLEIDSGLLTALLRIPEYLHGARSMENVVTRCITAEGSLMRSSLPPWSQLALHVKVHQFRALIEQDMAFKSECEKLAPYVHGFFLALGKREGWSLAYPMPYAKLPPIIKADNIAAARRIPEVLSLIGLQVVRKDGGRPIPPRTLKSRLEENIEALAEAEHDGWMAFKLTNGWRHGSPRNDEAHVHPALVPYAQLPEADQEKDRNSVRYFPAIVARARYQIVEEE